MTDLEVVVLSILTRRGIAGDSIHVFYMEEAVGAAREHLVRIALMADVEDELVVRRVEDVVECDSSLDESEVRSDVTAVITHAVEDALPDLTGEGLQLLCVEALDVFRAMDIF